MKTGFLLPILATCTVAITTGHSQILTIAEYTFTGGSVASVTSNYSVTAGNVVDTKSYIGASGSNNNFFIAATDGTNPAYSTTVADAIATDRRFSITLTPDSGTPI
jgi:hypothetical protein